MTRRLLACLLPLLLLVAACGDDDDADTADAGGSAAAAEGACEVVGGVDGGDSEIHVTLAEFSVDVEEETAEAGVVTIEATNEGAEPHELVILDGPPEEIELNEEGEVDESGLVGEIEPFDGGTECQGSFELAAGSYTLLCAIVDEMGHSHYDEGMVTGLTVQ